jgi:hypothetical protein
VCIDFYWNKNNKKVDIRVNISEHRHMYIYMFVLNKSIYRYLNAYKIYVHGIHSFRFEIQGEKGPFVVTISCYRKKISAHL